MSPVFVPGQRRYLRRVGANGQFFQLQARQGASSLTSGCAAYSSCMKFFSAWVQWLSSRLPACSIRKAYAAFQLLHPGTAEGRISIREFFIFHRGLFLTRFEGQHRVARAPRANSLNCSPHPPLALHYAQAGPTVAICCGFAGDFHADDGSVVRYAPHPHLPRKARLAPDARHR